MTVETERLVEASLRVGDDKQFDAITFSHGLIRKQAYLRHATHGFSRASNARARAPP